MSFKRRSAAQSADKPGALELSAIVRIASRLQYSAVQSAFRSDLAEAKSETKHQEGSSSKTAGDKRCRKTEAPLTQRPTRPRAAANYYCRQTFMGLLSSKLLRAARRHPGLWYTLPGILVKTPRQMFYGSHHRREKETAQSRKTHPRPSGLHRASAQ